MALSNKEIRERREFETLFKNPKFARESWSQKVVDRWCKPALEPIAVIDKDGNLTQTSQIEIAVWNHLKAEIEEEGSNRIPTEGEMMEACQQYYSRHNPAAYVARRDSMGAKPVDESKQNLSVNNPLEDYSDEELEVMQKALEEHKQKALEERKTEELEAAPDDKNTSEECENRPEICN